jgi:hypothetical protein
MFEQLVSPTGSSVINVKAIFIGMGLILFLTGLNNEKINILDRSRLNAISPVLFFSFFTLPVINIFCSILIAYQLWRRYSLGLIKEYKNLIVFFGAISIAFLLESFFILDQTNNVLLGSISARYGIIWFMYIFFRVTALLFLTLWAFNYLRFRIYPLLLTMISSIVVVISISSAFIYSLVMYNSIKGEFLNQIQRNVETIQFDINQLKESSKSLSRSFSLNDELHRSLLSNNYDSLNNLLNIFIETSGRVEEIVITDNRGNIVSSTNQELINQDISKELFINRALGYKEENSGLFLQKNSLGNKLTVVAVSPIVTDDNEVIGTIEIEYFLDNEYADSIKSQTGLDVIIFAEDKRSATTFTAEDGVSRLVNLRESDNQIINTVLIDGEVYKGETRVLNTPYFAAYVPVIDPREIPVGMIFTGTEQSILTDTLSKANSDMFLLSLIISVISLIPTKYLADFIDENYRA